MNRRRFIAASATAAGSLLAADAGLVEPRRLEVTRHDLDPHPAPGRARITLAQLSDLHLKRVGRIHHHLAERLSDIRPDLVVVTGDAVDRADALPVLDRFLSLLDRTTPTYAILGNWDHWSDVGIPELARVYERFGVRLLVNETVVHEHAGRRLSLTGLDDLVAGRPDLHAAVRDAPSADARLLLAHCPEHRDAVHRQAEPPAGSGLRQPPPDLAPSAFRAMLSGHTHGGQVAFFGYAPVLPRGSGAYVRGWFREPGRIPLYVNRGIGETGLPVRFGSLPELAVFTLAV